MTVATSIYSYSTSSTAKAYLGGDEKADLVPSMSSTYDVRAADWNNIVSGLVECSLRTRYGAGPCCSMWSQADCTASQTAVHLARASAADAALTELVAISSGFIVGLAVRCESARSAGTCTIKVEVNGTPKTINVVLNGTDTQKAYTRQTTAAAAAAATPDTFVAGDIIGVTVTTDGSWATAGATPSIAVDLYLHFGD